MRLKVGASLLALFAFAAVGSATPLTLTLDDGSSSVTVTDMDNDGIVTWAGSLGVWNINISSGIGFPSLGSLSSPNIDLISYNQSNNAGTLTLWLTQGGFTAPGPPAFVLDIGGTTDGAVQAYACAGIGLTPAACSDVALGSFGSGAFAGSGWFPFSSEEEYEVGIKVVINHGAGEDVNTSFDAELSSVPEPGTYALIGAGLLGLGLLRRRMS